MKRMSSSALIALLVVCAACGGGSEEGPEPIRIERQRKGRVRTFELADELLGLERAEPRAIRLTLALRGQGGSLRPDEVLREVFGERAAAMQVVREELLVDWNGRLVDPLLAASASSSHVQRAAL